jgi:hypothetical protein
MGAGETRPRSPHCVAQVAQDHRTWCGVKQPPGRAGSAEIGHGKRACFSNPFAEVTLLMGHPHRDRPLAVPIGAAWPGPHDANRRGPMRPRSVSPRFFSPRPLRLATTRLGSPYMRGR